jgi:hypothetical protein
MAFDTGAQSQAFLEQCRQLARAAERGEGQQATAHGLSRAVQSIADTALRRLAIAEALAERTALEKASSDDPKRPGWPAGTPGGRGGKFRPKDGELPGIGHNNPPPDPKPALLDRVRRLATRRLIRERVMMVLRVVGEAVAEIVPGLDVAATAAIIADIAVTSVELARLKHDAEVANEWASAGPRSIEQLRVEPQQGKTEFPNTDEFKKGELDQEDLAKIYGGAGDGMEYHHIVPQGGANAENIPPEKLHSVANIVKLPKLVHEAVSAEYNKIKEGTGMTVYQWMQTQPYERQLEEGMKILRDLNILK